MNEIIKSLFQRKSTRAFLNREIPKAAKETILKAAVQAPSAGNQQLYTILDITDRNLLEALSVTCDNQPFIAKAKLALIFLADCRKWHQGYREAGLNPRNPGAGDLMLAVCDACIAAQNAVVAAESLGIGSCYIGDILEQCEKHRELLKLPPYVVPAVMLVFGYPTKQQQQRPKPARPSLSSIVHENAYREMESEELHQLFRPGTDMEAYQKWLNAFCERKYQSDFSREMTRSVEEYLKDFLSQDRD